MRRKYFDLHHARPSALTKEALGRIGARYAIEDEIRGKPPDQQRAVRQAKSLVLIDDFETSIRDAV